MRQLLFTFLILFLTVPVFAQDEIFTIVETNPEFPGGPEEMYTFLGQNMHYPPKARDKNIQGRVYVSFVVEKDGHITDVRVIRGIGGGCDEEAIRVVKLMPRWEPGYQRGKAVRVRFNLPILFKLTGGKTKKKKKTDSGPIPIDNPNQVYYIVDKYPILGANNLNIDTYVSNNLVTPEGESEFCKCYVAFVIETNGNISNIEVTKSCGEAFDVEAKKVIESTSGNWIPGEKDGHPVRVGYNIRVIFNL